MKASIYNSYIPITEATTLVYNSFGNDYLLVDVNNAKKIEQQIFSELPDRLLKELKNKRFVLPKEIDESSLLLFDRIKKYETDSHYNLILNPTLNCNLSCWYCYETKTPSRMSPTMVESIKKFISNTLKEGTPIEIFDISFFGGEPLINFNDVALPIMQITKEICQNRGIIYRFDYTTNSYLINDRMIEIMKEYQPINFQITLDGCEEEHNSTRFLKNGKGTYRKVIESIKSLVKNDFDVTVRLNYTHKNIVGMIKIVDDLKELSEYKNVSIAFERVWQDYREGNIEEEVETVKEKFKSVGFNIGELKYSTSPKWCYGNRKNTAVLNYNGDIFKCTARDFKRENREGYINEDGSIIWDEERVENRYRALFKNKMCYSCRIAPICTEICSQKAVEEGNKLKCVYNEDRKNELIMTRFLSFINEKYYYNT